MKILVLGATGMVGHVITIFLNEKRYDVTALSRKKIKYCKYIIGEITKFDLIKKTINNGNYNLVINAVGVLNKNAEDKKSVAILINSYLPHYLSEITKNTKTKIVHISTDCVFSGKNGDYTENSFRDGQSFYDRSKALGELNNEKDLTFRSSIVGPDINKNGIGLLNWFMKQNGNIFGYNKNLWTGVTSLTLAKAIEVTIRENIFGIYNLVNNKIVSKYELLQLFNKNMRHNKIKILPSDEIKLKKTLINTRNDFSFKVPSYEEMVIELKKWIDAHKDLYPHYF